MLQFMFVKFGEDPYNIGGIIETSLGSIFFN